MEDEESQKRRKIWPAERDLISPSGLKLVWSKSPQAPILSLKSSSRRSEMIVPPHIFPFHFSLIPVTYKSRTKKQCILPTSPPPLFIIILPQSHLSLMIDWYVRKRHRLSCFCQYDHIPANNYWMEQKGVSWKCGKNLWVIMLSAVHSECPFHRDDVTLGEVCV